MVFRSAQFVVTKEQIQTKSKDFWCKHKVWLEKERDDIVGSKVSSERRWVYKYEFLMHLILATPEEALDLQQNGKCGDHETRREYCQELQNSKVNCNSILII